MRVEHALNLKLGISTCCIILMEYLKVGRDLQATVSAPPIGGCAAKNKKLLKRGKTGSENLNLKFWTKN